MHKKSLLTTTTKNIITYFFKAALLALAFIFIYNQYIKQGDNLKQFQYSIANLNHTYVVIVMTVVCLLMLVNWLLECFKWKYLVRNLEPISIWKAIEGVFCGLTIAVITPNRIGEYGGRIITLSPRKRIYGFFAMATGSFGQLVVTNIVGSAAGLWFLFVFLQFSSWAYIGFSVLAGGIIAFYLTLFFNVKWVAWLLNRIPYVKKYHRFFDILANYKFNELLIIMLYCVTRFFVFSSQYYLLIHMLIPEMPFYNIFLMVFVVLFIRSAIPSIDVIDATVGSVIATTIFNYATHHQLAIIASFTTIWLINLIIPAILGSVFIFKLNFFGRNI